MTSSNVFILLALLRTLTDGGRKTFVDSVIDESENNSVFNLMLKQFINDLYILEVSKSSDKENFEHVLHLYKKIYDPIKNEKAIFPSGSLQTSYRSYPSISISFFFGKTGSSSFINGKVIR